MATFLEMFDHGFLLVTNTLILIVITLSMGPVIDFLAAWLPTMPAGRISIAPIQMVFTTFYAFIILLEVVLFVGWIFVVIRRTDYDTGEGDF